MGVRTGFTAARRRGTGTFKTVLAALIMLALATPLVAGPKDSMAPQIGAAQAEPNGKLPGQSDKSTAPVDTVWQAALIRVAEGKLSGDVMAQTASPVSPAADPAPQPAARTVPEPRRVEARPVREAFNTESILFSGVEELKPGDVLQFNLPGEPTLTGTFQIDRFGKLVLPEIGPVVAAGLTAQQLEDKIVPQLERFYRDLGGLSVFIKERRVFVSVSGHVGKPGLVELSPDGDLESAIAAAGGLRTGAQLDKIKVRRGAKTIPVNYRAYLDTGDTNLLPKLQPLDEIFVPITSVAGNVEMEITSEDLNVGDVTEDAEQSVSVFGEVHNPGRFNYRDTSSIVDYLLRGGGTTRFAAVEKIRVLAKDGTPISFDLTAYLDQGEAVGLPQIAPDTTIFVPRLKEAVEKTAQTVYVMGEVQKPGAYEAGKNAGFLDVLANAGGPTRYAEIREIRVLRGNGEIAAFDLVAYTEGKAKTLPGLQSGDAIFIPEKADQLAPSWLKVQPERSIYLMGAVADPGRYEWSTEMSILDLIAHGGGPNEKADIANVTIVPGGADKGLPTLRFDMQAFIDNPEGKVLPALKSQYMVLVPQLPDDPSDNKAQWVRQAPEASIYVLGAVNAPGRYGFNDKMGFLDILSAADGPADNADLRSVQITHRDRETGRVETFDLTQYLESGDDSTLPTVKTGDVIFIPTQNAPFRGINVLGAVGNPGRFEWSGRLTLLELVAQAGGPTERSDLAHVVITPAPEAEGQEAVLFNLEAVMRGAKAELPLLHSGDTVFIPELPDDPHDNKAKWVRQAPEASIYVLGAINAPGRYGFNDSLGFLDILSAADGPTITADLRNIQITHRDRSVDRVETFDMQAYLEAGDDGLLPKVVPGDVIYIPTEDRPLRGVNVIGSVHDAGQFEWSQNLTILEVLAQANGPTRRGDLTQVLVAPPPERASEQPVRIYDIERYMRYGDIDLPTLSKGETVMVPELPDDPTDNKAHWVKQSPEESIYILGRVNAPGRYKFADHLGLLDILGAADGPSDDADLSRVFVIHRGGSGRGVSVFNFLQYRDTGDDSLIPPVARGDVVFLVPTDGPQRRVGIIGEVNNPGQFEWREDMSLVDLIERAGGPKENADTANIRITPGGADQGMPAVTFNLKEFYALGDLGKQPRIRPGYSVMIDALPIDPQDNKARWVRQPSDQSIYVFGEVGRPGRYMFNDRLHFLDILSAADGPTRNADIHNVRITNRNGRTAQVQGINLAMYFETGDEAIIPRVLPGDVIYVPDRDRSYLDNSKEVTVRVLGAVRDPGRYKFDDTMTILDLLAEAGGPVNTANVHHISVVNLSCCEDRARSFDLVRFASTGDFGSLPVVRQGDTIYVPYEEGGPIDDVLDRATGIVPFLTLLLLLL